MARTRNIKPAFFDNDDLASLDPLVRLLFIGLWCLADREGRLEDRPRRIRKAILGYDDVTVEEVNGMLQQLADNDFIIRYCVDETAYIQVTNFSKHQNPNMKEKESEIPPPGAEHHYNPAPSEPEELPADQGGDEPAEAATDAPDLLTQRFDAFWAAYPNKKYKEDTRKVWKKLRPNAALFEKIMKAVELQKRTINWTKENGAYVPNPAKWLRGGGWENEVREEDLYGEHSQHIRNDAPGAADQSRPGGSGTPAGFHED